MDITKLPNIDCKIVASKLVAAACEELKTLGNIEERRAVWRYVKEQLKAEIGE